MKSSNRLEDGSIDNFAEIAGLDVPQNLFLFTEESSNVSASHHIKFTDDRQDPNQVNIARTAAKLNNSKGIKQNFYSRAQDNLNKRYKQEKQNKVSVAFADAVKSVKHVKNFADQLDFPFDLTTAAPKPLTPRSPPVAKLNALQFTFPIRDGSGSGSAPQTPRSLGGASLDNLEYQSFLRDNKGALRHMMTDINGSLTMEGGTESSFYERNEKLGAPMTVNITSRSGSLVDDRKPEEVKEEVIPALHLNATIVAPPTSIASPSSARKVSFDFDEFQDYVASNRSPSSSPTVKHHKTASFGPATAGDITKIEITYKEKPQPTVPAAVVEKIAEAPLRSTTPPPPVVIVTPRLNVIGDSSNNGWGGVSLMATSTTTIITSDGVHSPISGGNTPVVPKGVSAAVVTGGKSGSSQWNNETSILSLGSFQAPAVLGGGFRPRSAPTSRSNGISGAEGVQRQPVPPSSVSNKPGYILNTHATNLANIVLSKNGEPVVNMAPIEVTGIPTMASGERNTTSQSDLRASVPTPSGSRPSSASPRVQSAVTFRNNQATELLTAKKMTTAATAAGTMSTNAMKNDRTLQRAANQEELTRFVFNPAESANMVTSKAVHEEVVQHQKKNLTTPNQNVTITVVAPVGASPADKKTRQRPHTADGLMRSRAPIITGGVALTSGTATLPKIQSPETKAPVVSATPAKVVSFSDVESASADPLSISPDAVALMQTQLNRFLNIVEPEVATDRTLEQFEKKKQQARATALEEGLLDDTQENEKDQKPLQVDWKAFATPTKKPSTAPTLLKPTSSLSDDLQSPVPSAPHYAKTTPLMLLTNDLLSEPTVDDPDYFQTTAFSLEAQAVPAQVLDDCNPLLESPLEPPRFNAPEVAPPARSPLQIAKRHKHYSSYVKSILYADLSHANRETGELRSQPSTPRSPERISYEEYRQAGKGSSMAEIMGKVPHSPENRPSTTSGVVSVDVSGNAEYVRLNGNVKSPRVSEMAQLVNNIHAKSLSAGKAPRSAGGFGTTSSALNDHFVAWNAGSFDAAGYYQEYQNASDLLVRLDLAPESPGGYSNRSPHNTATSIASVASSELNVSSAGCSLSPRAAPHSKAIVKAYTDSLNKKMSKEKEIRLARIRKQELKRQEEERQRVLAMNAKVKAALAEAKSRTGHRHGVPQSSLHVAPAAGTAVTTTTSEAVTSSAEGAAIGTVEENVDGGEDTANGAVELNDRVTVRFDAQQQPAM